MVRDFLIVQCFFVLVFACTADRARYFCLIAAHDGRMERMGDKTQMKIT